MGSLGRRSTTSTRSWWVVVGVVCAACSPSVTSTDHEQIEVGTFPGVCRSAPQQTSSGAWACRLESGAVGFARDGAERQDFPADGVQVTGRYVWIWTDAARRLEDLGSGPLVENPAESFGWTSPIFYPVRSAAAREQEIFLSHGGVTHVAVDGGSFELVAQARTLFNESTHFSGVAHEMVDLGDQLGLVGPIVTSSDNLFVCTLALSDYRPGPCTETKGAHTLGLGYGAVWIDDTEGPVRMYSFDNFALELPALDWKGGTHGLPWALSPDPTTMIVPRFDGDRLSFDRYHSHEGMTWAGASETVVWEVDDQTTKIYRR